jgi:AmiR/NasT family two-component response regulator
VALLLRRETNQARRQAAQLQAALDSRVLIEQAKGMLAERVGITPDEAFALLRGHARNHNQKLIDLAHEIVHGDVEMLSRIASA